MMGWSWMVLCLGAMMGTGPPTPTVFMTVVRVPVSGRGLPYASLS